MGHIKEPAGVDFVVDPTPLTVEDRKQISKIIAYYKATGKKMPSQKKEQEKIAAQLKKYFNEKEKRK